MKLNQLRSKIDRLDIRIIELLSQRLLLSKEIAVIKKENKLKLKDTRREKEIYKRVPSLWLKQIFKIIIEKSLKIQKEYYENS